MATNVEVIETLIKGTATVVIPLACVWIAHVLSRTFRERELSTKYIEIAVDILKEKPNDQQAALRRWASDLINHYSEIRLPAEAQDNLVSNAPLTTERLSEEKFFAMQKGFYEKDAKK
jgi:hypothetical protein